MCRCGVLSTSERLQCSTGDSVEPVMNEWRKSCISTKHASTLCIWYVLSPRCLDRSASPPPTPSPRSTLHRSRLIPGADSCGAAPRRRRLLWRGGDSCGAPAADDHWRRRLNRGARCLGRSPAAGNEANDGAAAAPAAHRRRARRESGAAPNPPPIVQRPLTARRGPCLLSDSPVRVGTPSR